MHLSELLTDDAVLAELGRRLERQRLGRDWTQDQLAREAQVGRATVQRLERGAPVQSISLVKVLRALELLPALDDAVPESIELPIVELERERRRMRQRARGGRASGGHGGPPREPWRWGVEREEDA